MDINVHGKHNRVPDAMEKFAIEKVGKLPKFLPTITYIEVELYEDGKVKEYSHIAEVTVLANGPSFRTKSTGPDHKACIDIAVDRLTRQLTDHHRKNMAKPAHARHAKEVPPLPPLDVEEAPAAE